MVEVDKVISGTSSIAWTLRFSEGLSNATVASGRIIKTVASSTALQELVKYIPMPMAVTGAFCVLIGVERAIKEWKQPDDQYSRTDLMKQVALAGVGAVVLGASAYYSWPVAGTQQNPISNFTNNATAGGTGVPTTAVPLNPPSTVPTAFPICSFADKHLFDNSTIVLPPHLDTGSSCMLEFAPAELTNTSTAAVPLNQMTAASETLQNSDLLPASPSTASPMCTITEKPLDDSTLAALPRDTGSICELGAEPAAPQDIAQPINEAVSEGGYFARFRKWVKI